MKRLIKYVLIILSVFFASFGYAAFKIPDFPKNHVSDYADILESSQEESFNSILRNYEEITTNQIFVGIFDSLKGESLEDLSIRIAEKWKPGLKNKDNGVLLLIFMRDAKVRIEIGYGLEAILTDALANAVIVNEIKPEFKKGNYYLGIENSLTGMMKILSKDISKSDLEEYLYKAKAKKGNPIFSFIILIILILFFIRHPFLALFLLSSGFSSGGRYSGGGSFGGGGGSFGGGGASGGW